MATLRSFLILLAAQLAGEALHRALHLPLPGAVLGMALLAVILLLRKREPDAALVQTSNGLLRWLGLLFIPAGAGVVANLGLLRSAWLPITVALLLSTALTVAATALVMQWLLRRGQRVAITSEQR
ncbi:CidA/LrgA family protein [Terriglobus sp. TAA 43]|uniref:CidA/LrgA family protein n=1 Tax=Terriglobus sp. TAA 43 TaxID=278961 RepID=UPI0006465F73|nr:CidA/LrgA family protein [Terriglobus sp. TAA 43]